MRVSLPSASALPQVVSVATVEPGPGGTPTWLIGGATAPAPPTRRPALWSATQLSASPIDAAFSAAAMEPLPGYGEIAELFGVTGHREADASVTVAAIGQAFGGAHGNPRTASWVGTPTAMSEVRANFELYNGVRQIAVRAIASGNGLHTIIGSRVNQNGRLGAAAWTSVTGNDFVLHDDDPALSSAANEQVQALALAAVNHGSGSTPTTSEFIAAGERLWWDPANSADTIGTDAILWTSTDGQQWRRYVPDGFVLGGPGEERITALGVNPAAHPQPGGRLLAAGTESIDGQVRAVVWTSAGKRRIAAMGVSDDPLSAATSVARVGRWWVVGARMGGVLKLAKSLDARTWLPIAMPPTDVPTGGRAKVVILPDTGSALWIGLSGLNGGGLWSRPLQP